MSDTRGTHFTFFIMYLSPLTSKVYLLVNLFEKPVHNAVRLFSCLHIFAPKFMLWVLIRNFVFFVEK